MSVLHPELLVAGAAGSLPVHIVLKDGPLDGLGGAATAAWAGAHEFTGKTGQLLILPGPDGAVAGALFGAGESFDPNSARALAARLPAGLWRLEGVNGTEAEAAALAFALGGYRFDRYRARPGGERSQLVAPKGMDVAAALRIAAACALAREMVDTPAADMGPLQIETIAREIASESKARGRPCWRPTIRPSMRSAGPPRRRASPASSRSAGTSTEPTCRWWPWSARGWCSIPAA